jgi:hypothetical protein
MVMKMEIEDDGAAGGTGGTWTEEDRALGAAVLGADAFAYLTKGGGANDFTRGDCDKEAQQQGVVMLATCSPKVSAPSAFAHPDPRSMRP